MTTKLNTLKDPRNKTLKIKTAQINNSKSWVCYYFFVLFCFFKNVFKSLKTHVNLSNILVPQGVDKSFKKQSPRYSQDPTLMPWKTNSLEGAAPSA